MENTNNILDNILSWANNENKVNNKFEAGIEYAKRIILAIAEKKNLDYTIREIDNQIFVVENGNIICPFCNDNELDTNKPTGMEFVEYCLSKSTIVPKFSKNQKLSEDFMRNFK